MNSKSRAIILSFVMISTYLAFIVNSYCEVMGVAGDPVPAKVVEWKDMVALDQAKAKVGIKETPTFVPRMPGPGILQIPKDAKVGPVGPASEITIATSPTRNLSPLAAVTIASFSAKTDNGIFIPPDTMGAAGPSHLFVAHNGTMRIQDKTGGVISDVTLDSFWGISGFAAFDPKIYYDEDIGRWITVCSDSGGSSNSSVLLGVSSTSDPTQSWYLRYFKADSGSTTWADYPGVGFNQKWIAISMNMFKNSNNAFVGPKMWVFNISTAANPGTLTPSIFSTGFDGGGFTLLPCHTFGNQTNLYILDSGWAAGSNYYARVSRLAGTTTSPGWASVGFADVQDYSTTGIVLAPQFGTSTGIEAGDTRIINAVFRNGCMWYAQTGGMPLAAATRDVALWHQVSTDLSIINQGMIDGASGSATTFYFYPSIAVTSTNDIGIGFAGSVSTGFCGAYYTNRPNGGSVQPIATLKAGIGTYVKEFGGGENRWGDYSQTCIDPSDGKVWTIQEYALSPTGSAPNTGVWATWWGKFDAASVPVEISDWHNY